MPENLTATLTLETLHLLSPDLAEDFRQQLAIAVADCRQRPSCSDKREVTLKLVVVPHPDDADDVLLHLTTGGKTPARKILPLRARMAAITDQLQFDFAGDE